MNFTLFKLSLINLFFFISVYADVWTSFRKDYDLDRKEYPEDKTSAPDEGGRIHLILPTDDQLTGVKGPLTVAFNTGETLNLNKDFDWNSVDTIDWCRSEVNMNTKQVWLSLHSSKDDFIKNVNHVDIKDSTGTIVSSSDFRLSDKTNGKVSVSYITTRNKFSEFLIHVHNFDTDNDQTVNQVMLDGAIISDIQPFTLKPNGHKVLVSKSPLVSNHEEGDLWSVGIVMADNSRYGWGGRIVKEHFFVEDWPKSDDCPFPGVNEENYNTLKDFGIDTHYLGKGGSCGVKGDQIMENMLNVGQYAITSESWWEDLDQPLFNSTMYPTVAAMLISDEGDDNLEHAHENSVRYYSVHELYPELAVYQGGHTHTYMGAFSGLTDIQGMDFYIAACAPHVTSFDSTMQVQGAYDYLKNTRNNHMPLPMWGYSQWEDDGWPIKQLQTGELIVQLASVVASGSKSLMLFQSDMKHKDQSSFKDSGKFIKSIAHLGEDIRQADIGGGGDIKKSCKDHEAIVEVLQGPDSIILLVLSTNADGYSDVLCYSHMSAHWNFKDFTIDSINFHIPDDFKIGEVKEIKNGDEKDSDATFSQDGNKITVSNVKLGVNNVAKFYKLTRA